MQDIKTHKKHAKLSTILVVAVVFGAIGVLRLFLGSAAIAAVSLESEQGTATGKTSVQVSQVAVSGSGFTSLNTQSAQACGTGGTCNLSDIQTHVTSTDCRSAVNVDGVTSAYAIPDSWLTIHRDNYKNIVTKLCGKVFGSDLHTSVGEHHDGTNYDGKQMIDWIRNFYIGPYQ